MLEGIVANQVLDIEWKFGVTAASSEMTQVGTTFLHLKIILDIGNEQTKCVYLEMTLPKFYAFLHELEKAKASLDYLS